MAFIDNSSINETITTLIKYIKRHTNGVEKTVDGEITLFTSLDIFNAKVI
jgi:hypothetical protein